MRFIVDAQLPIRLANWFRNRGFDCVHTLDLPEANRTSDNFIREINIAENRIVVSKDTDFRQSFLVNRIPPKLILVTTGNISNNQLLELFERNRELIIGSIEQCDMIEININEVIAYGN